ncbi:uncharacterized protein [Typha latifolia]|uniref:uncharacterized protein isoform X2 n=1 Tax=Typha latifolia TaxID=4733 RepID=UPI003C2B8CB9
MASPILRDVPKVEFAESFITKLHASISKGLPHASPASNLRIDERELVQGVLQMLQGFCTRFLYWDENMKVFLAKDGIYASHISQTSLKGILNLFLFAGTCLKRVELFVLKVESSGGKSPTLSAFAYSVYLWLTRLRDVAVKEEEQLFNEHKGKIATLLGLINSLQSLCAGAEHLSQVVYGAIPNCFFHSTALPACELAVHILNYLYKKLNEVCLVQGGEGDLYHMMLTMFTGSLLPYLQGLDSWLYDGILDDPYEEIFFYANGVVTIDQPSFWETSYPLRVGNKDVLDAAVCPVFLNDIAKSIISAGKSLQLVQHVQDDYAIGACRDKSFERRDSKGSQLSNHQRRVGFGPEVSSSLGIVDETARWDSPTQEYNSNVYHRNNARVMGVLTLSEAFLLSLAGLLDHGEHIYENLRMFSSDVSLVDKSILNKPKIGKEAGENIQNSVNNEKTWLQLLADAVEGRRHLDSEKMGFLDSRMMDKNSSSVTNEVLETMDLPSAPLEDNQFVKMSECHLDLFFPGNPVITICKELLGRNIAAWNELNISSSSNLPPLNDENLREAVFGGKYSEARMSNSPKIKAIPPRFYGTDYTCGFQFNELEHLRLEDDTRILENLYSFPTLLPCFQEDVPLSEILPFQKDSSLASRILKFIQSVKLKDSLHPAVIIQECLTVYIERQVDHIGKYILQKLMGGWRLMDELFVLRAIYLLGSGDLLQQFLIVIFNRLDKGDSWDDDFELNTMLQESIQNSSDRMLLSAPDSLIVSISKHSASDEEENISTPQKIQNQYFGIDALDMLKFTYKVSWPLDLIANTEALKKYNQVMGFLLKVKRAKFVLDKARKWMWKRRGSKPQDCKHHLLLQQKLLHFVDAFHQYVMDQVFHSAWTELCSGMASASSLDEVIEVHEAYLLSIQRQCFVAPDKLWALIASRIKTILGLALDFYAIEQTLSSGGAAPAVKARCEMEIDRIEKQFDDCVSFLLRILSFKLNVGHFPHLADLVTRINYNYFYMSNSGNLLTVPNFESTAKLGKPPAFRA